MHLVKLAPPDLKNIGIQIYQQQIFSDERGSLRLWYESMGNDSLHSPTFKIADSHPRVGRGLHRQNSRSPQTKVITVFSGEVFDFFFDPERPDVLYYIHLCASDGITLCIPPKYAHGYITISRTCFMYSCFGLYDEENEQVFNFLPLAARALNIDSVTISSKDRLGITTGQIESNS